MSTLDVGKRIGDPTQLRTAPRDSTTPWNGVLAAIASLQDRSSRGDVRALGSDLLALADKLSKALEAESTDPRHLSTRLENAAGPRLLSPFDRYCIKQTIAALADGMETTGSDATAQRAYVRALLADLSQLLTHR